MTDCYAVVFEKEGCNTIAPVSQFSLTQLNGVWMFWENYSDAFGPISQVWHCPSPVTAATLLRTIATGFFKNVEEDFVSGDGCTLICRNEQGGAA